MAPSVELDLLLVAARRGDARALERLFERAFQDLRLRLLRVIGSRQRKLTVDDLFEETTVHALRGFPSLRALTYSGFRSWFASIARNRLRVAERAARVRALPESHRPPDEVTVPEEVRTHKKDELLRRGVSRLTRSHRVAFVLREGLELSWATIGFVLARRQAEAARLVHFRARARLVRLVSTCALA